MPPETRSKRKSLSTAEIPQKFAKHADLRTSGEGGSKLRASSTAAPAPPIQDSKGATEAAPPVPQDHSVQPTGRRRGRATQPRAAAAQTQQAPPGSCAATAADRAPERAPTAAALDPAQPTARGDGIEASAAPNLANPDQAQMERPAPDDDQDPAHPFGSALQGLLRKLGAGFEDLLPGVLGMGGGKVKAIITGLRSFEDEGQQLSSLTELCEFLSIASEDALASFPLETVVPLLVQLLNLEHHPDIMLLAARALTFMADALPTSCGVIARHGAIPVFCARLLTIEYIDLAEQSLQALEKLSHEYSHMLLQHGGLLAVLSYLDFFPTGVQRVAVVTAANMCRGLSVDNAEAVKAAVPILTSLLQYSDAKVVDHACIALSHIADAFAAHPDQLAQFSSSGLITQALQLIAISESGTMNSQLSLGTYFSLIKLLTTCVRSSPAVAQTVLQAAVLDTLSQLLATSSMLSSSGGPATSSVVRSVEQLHDVMLLLSELLPPIPDAPAAVQAGLPLAGPAAGANSSSARERLEFLQGNPQLLARFSSQLLPLLLQVHATTVMPQVRHTCLVAISKILCVSPPEMLDESIKELPVSNFVAGLLLGRDAPAAAYAMQMAEVLIGKLPSVFRASFLKEGVVHAMEQLVAAQAAAPAAPAPEAVQAAPPAAGPSAPPAPAPAANPEPGTRVTRSSSRLKESHEKDKGKEKASKEKEAKEKAEKEKAEEKEKLRKSAAPARAEPPKAAAPVKPKILEALAVRAAKFKQTHYGDGSGAALETEGLAQMRKLCQGLPCANQQRLLELFEALAGNNISVFELLNSGAVRELLSYMTGEDLRQKPGSTSAAEWDSAMLSRIHDFVVVALPGSSSDSPTMVALVRKLQAALSSLDCFPVLSARFGPSPASRLAGLGSFGGRFSTSASAPGRGAQGSGAAGSSLSSSLAMLTQPLKLRLSRHAAERQLREYSSNIVMIEPLATMTAIEDFLHPRVLRSSPSPPEADGSAAATAAAATAVAVKKEEVAAAEAKADAAKAAKPEGSKGPAEGGAKEAGASGRGSQAARPGAVSKAQMIPEPSNRRVTRSQAARGEAATAPQPAPQKPGQELDASGHRDGGQGSDELMQDAANLAAAHDEEDLHKDHEFESHGLHEDEDEERPIFDEEDEEDEGGSFDDMDDGGEGDLDIQPMHVHDLHVEEPAAGGSEPAAAAGPSGQAAGAGAAPAAAAAATRTSGRIASSMPPAKAGPGSSMAAAAAAAAAVANKAAAGHAAAAAASAAAAQAAKPTAAAVVGQEGPKLVFYIGDRKLAPGTTVFQAVQQQYIAMTGAEAAEEQDEEAGAGADAGPGAAAAQQRRGRRLWDEIHTLSYRQASSVPSDEEAAAEAAAAAMSNCDLSRGASGSTEGGAAVGRWSASPIGELLSSTKLPALNAGQACKEVLQLLQLLEAINRLGSRLALALGPVSAPPSAAGAKPSACASSSGSDAQVAVADDPAHRRLPREEFVNQKLGSKLGQQLKDVLSICGGSMPPWVAQLIVSCKFLFPFEMRRRYFYCTAFGLGRALHHMQQLNTAESGGAAGLDPGRELRVGRLQRQKVRVSRKRILESAVKVMELYAKQRTVLEIEYFGEVGTGLGPTLEFFTLLSHDLQKHSLGLWRHEDNVKTDPMDVDQQGADRPVARSGEAPAALVPRGAEVWHEASEYVNAPWGLFPAPLPEKKRAAGSGCKVVDQFRLLGRTVAKALQDCRLMDLPFNYTFHKAVMGKRLDLFDISAFDPQLGHTLERMQASLQAHKACSAAGADLRIDGVLMSDLCLTFVLPGHPDFELRPGGADIDVTGDNLGEYIEALVDATLGSGIESQLKAFREGFNEVFALSTLECFYEDELETLLCGSGEHWTVQSLADSIKFDHGYTGSSPVVKGLLEVLSELDAADRRRFLRFVTGCPRLPPGGLAALQPQLTVVRKHPTTDTPPTGGTPVGSLKENSGIGTTAADCDLPSVMTCANYIKLPPYSSKEVLKQRLMYAISEGQGSFDLS